MALKKYLRRQTVDAVGLDEGLRDMRVSGAVQAIGELAARQQATLVGEITGVRVVTQPDNSLWLEATISDGTGHLVATWAGRRQIAGIRTGQRIAVTGRGLATGPGGCLVILNPIYELL